MRLSEFRISLLPFLMKMKDKKDFDAVKMMRDIRDKRHSEYEKNPQLREERLAAIRKKYAEKIKNQKTTRADI